MKLAKTPSHPATDCEGAITNGKKVPMVILAMLRSQGNGIAAEGVRQIPLEYRNVALMLQMSNRNFFTKVLIPSVLPYICIGLCISICLAWLAIIAAEIVMPGTPGIGFFIWNAYQNSYVSEIELGVIWIGAIGLILDRLMTWLQKRISSNH
jgi:bicarbonate transport system permease protein